MWYILVIIRTCALPDTYICTHPRCYAPLDIMRIYQAKHSCLCYNLYLSPNKAVHQRNKAYHIVQNICGQKLLWFLIELRMFSHEFQSVLALVNVALLQTQKFFHKYLATWWPNHKSFVPQNFCTIQHCIVQYIL